MADLLAVLHEVVDSLGGQRRPGQEQMVEAVDQAIRRRQHLLVQAGTGTGKSLAYLIPAAVHAIDSGTPVVIATATMALQAQLIDRDLPQLSGILAGRLGRPVTFATVKGRSNYVCRHKLGGGYPSDDDALLSVAAVDTAASALGEQVVRLREWSQLDPEGDRDRLVPGVSERAWRQVSVSARECLGSACPMVGECFVERARQHAREVDLIVTNHAFLAVDALEGRQLLPHHEVLIIDEGHELVDRVTASITSDLSGSAVNAAARRAGSLADTDVLANAADQLNQALTDNQPRRLESLPDGLSAAMNQVRDASRQVLFGITASGGPPDPTRQLARAAVEEVFEVAERLLRGDRGDVSWISEDSRGNRSLRVAPLSVAGVLNERVFGTRTVVLTSASLSLGGQFDVLATSLGLPADDASWLGLDVGSPFDYRAQGIVYVAAHLPAPGRDGTSVRVLDEIEALIRAAGGRTLGLFSSMRAAVAASQALSERFAGELEILCQGQDQTATLVRTFAQTASTCLFGTLSLWQGVDVPGPSCQLVIIDRLPFPRPDDPLASARSAAVTAAGGNGFLSVMAAHAGVRLAQGSGRLIRRSDDRGVVAILDPRLVTSRSYAGFLQRCVPPFWPTTDRATVLAALARLDAAAGPPHPVRPVSPPAEDQGASGPADAVSLATSSGAPNPRSARIGIVAGRPLFGDDADHDVDENGPDANRPDDKGPEAKGPSDKGPEAKGPDGKGSGRTGSSGTGPDDRG